MNSIVESEAMRREEEAALWCLSLAEGQLSTQEEEAFRTWIANPSNSAAFEEAVALLNLADAASNQPEVIQARGQSLEAFRRAQRRLWSRPWKLYWIGGAIAASLLLLASALIFAIGDPVQVLRTGVGERRLAVLEDGSRVSLDADSEVEVRLHRSRRELKLVSGRAKFDVAKDPLRPFSVTAGDKMVVATGTAFSVELADRQMRVLLYEGRVAVLDRALTSPVPQTVRGVASGLDQAFKPGTELVVSAGEGGTATLKAADLSQASAWESGQLSFDDEALPTAAARMNRYSAVKLIIGDKFAANIHVNGVYTAGNLEAFIEGVTMLHGLRAVKGPSGIMLVRG